MTTQPPSYEKKSLYEVGDILFSGSYATVKSAKIIATQKQVTAKIIFKKNFNGDIFEKEVGVLRELNHPNIVNFVDW
ncbi:hypothetical protein BGZ49_001475 [Haplosporangium sp. Z 27]|nr:hypothetical protein BGZ49_001475 [Haplosporangium sp. Z 27]